MHTLKITTFLIFFVNLGSCTVYEPTFIFFPGNFSFGSFTKFKSNTIVDFIENAVEHSRSGRYLFFLHRRPVFGPMRVQLLHPVSRFKQVQSLQHLCRYNLSNIPYILLCQHTLHLTMSIRRCFILNHKIIIEGCRLKIWVGLMKTMLLIWWNLKDKMSVQQSTFQDVF